MTLRRDWSKAEAKRTSCRICGNPNVDLAHIVGRARDERIGKNRAVVNPDSVVPLCRREHQLYDAHALDLMPYLELEEQVQAVRDAGGIEAARRRIIGRSAA